MYKALSRLRYFEERTLLEWRMMDGLFELAVMNIVAIVKLFETSWSQFHLRIVEEPVQWGRAALRLGNT